MYGTEVSPTLISSVTDAVMDEAKAWQVRPLDALYPIVYLDCIHAKVRDDGTVRVKAVYLALGVNLNGEKKLLGLWVASLCVHVQTGNLRGFIVDPDVPVSSLA